MPPKVTCFCVHTSLGYHELEGNFKPNPHHESALIPMLLPVTHTFWFRPLSSVSIHFGLPDIPSCGLPEWCNDPCAFSLISNHFSSTSLRSSTTRRAHNPAYTTSIVFQSLSFIISPVHASFMTQQGSSLNSQYCSATVHQPISAF